MQACIFIALVFTKSLQKFLFKFLVYPPFLFFAILWNSENKMDELRLLFFRELVKAEREKSGKSKSEEKKKPKLTEEQKKEREEKADEAFKRIAAESKGN